MGVSGEIEMMMVRCKSLTQSSALKAVSAEQITHIPRVKVGHRVKHPAASTFNLLLPMLFV